MAIKFSHDPRLKHWYVAFGETNLSRPIWKCLKKGFRHVWAFAFDAQAGSWIVFDPGWDGMVVRVVSRPEEVDRMFAKAYRGGPVLYVEAGKKMVLRPRFLLTCSSQICGLIGLNLFVHTPWRMFCALKRKGATTLLFED